MAKKEKKPVAQQAGEEVAAMQRLSQAAAAWLVEVDARVLRDHAIPRDAEGKYDAREVVKCFKGRQSNPTFNDDQEERLQLVVELIAGEYVINGEMYRCLRSLDDSYGDAGLAEFMRRLLGQIRSYGLIEPRPEPREADVRAEVERVMAEGREKRARDRLEIACVCERCGRMRMGKRWVKRKPPAGYAIDPGECPECEQPKSPGRRQVFTDPDCL